MAKATKTPPKKAAGNANGKAKEGYDMKITRKSGASSRSWSSPSGSGSVTTRWTGPPDTAYVKKPVNRK